MAAKLFQKVEAMGGNPDSAAAEEVGGKSREEIVKRIVRNAGATQGNHYVAAV